MKITLLGTSHGVPEPNRKCSCMMVEVGENIYFVDMGSSAIEPLRKRGKSIDAVKGIFITHMHGDHTNGLIQFIDLITWYFKTPDPVVVLPDPEAARVINDWLKINHNAQEKEIKFRKTAAGVVYDDSLLKVTAIPTQHCPDSHAYVLEAEGKTVLCTGDLMHPAQDFPYVDKELDLMICESAHFATSEYLPVLEKQSVKKICVTHYTPRKMKCLYEFKELMEVRNQSVLIATDDLEFIV